jgi:hypothetical protein
VCFGDVLSFSVLFGLIFGLFVVLDYMVLELISLVLVGRLLSRYSIGLFGMVSDSRSMCIAHFQPLVFCRVYGVWILGVSLCRVISFGDTPYNFRR